MTATRRILVQIRKQDKILAKSHVAEAFGISRATLNRRIKEGLIDPPTGRRSKYSLKDVEKLYERFGMPAVRLRGRGKAYFEDTVRCNLRVIGGGIFLVSSKVKTKGESALIEEVGEYKQMIKRYGLWDAQGLCNHIHLSECSVSNPVLQLILAGKVTNSWIEKLKEIRPKAKVLITWLGAVDTILCVYLMSPEGETIVDKFEREQQIKGVSVTEFEFR
jgi:hypothetical protein